MSRTLFSIVTSVAIALFAGSCNDESSSSSGGSLAGSGCIQGVAVDAMTGDRVPLAQSASDKGVFVLMRSELRGASLMGDNSPADPLRGEFYLCGIHVDENFPLFAWVDGYAPFESLVKVASTHKARSDYAQHDIIRPKPTEVVNILLYPKDHEVQDLNINVLHNGAPLTGATVNLRPTGGNFLDPNGSVFWPAANIRQKPLTATSNEAGLVTFPAAELVLGGRYTYTVIPPNGGMDQTSLAAGTFVVGLRDGKDSTEPYNIFVDLKHTVGSLVELSRSTDTNDPNSEGKLVIYFNREIELVPGTIDGIAGDLNGNTTATLATDVPGNEAVESVGVKIDGNMLTLIPNFVTFPNADISTEIDMSITYQSIKLRPKTTPESASELSVSGTVSFYR